MSDTRLYHNPRCSKSRETLELLQQKGINPQVVHYLDTPPTADELLDLLRMLNLPARALLRTGESEYAELGLADPAKSDEQIIEALANHPRLIQRPIFVHRGRATLGRPPEQVLDLL
ncbi:MAG: arsenate reductase (glutaredoxin) [Lysobacter sp.]